MALGVISLVITGVSTVATESTEDFISSDVVLVLTKDCKGRRRVGVELLGEGSLLEATKWICCLF